MKYSRNIYTGLNDRVSKDSNQTRNVWQLDKMTKLNLNQTREIHVNILITLHAIKNHMTSHNRECSLTFYGFIHSHDIHLVSRTKSSLNNVTNNSSKRLTSFLYEKNFFFISPWNRTYSSIKNSRKNNATFFIEVFIMAYFL